MVMGFIDVPLLISEVYPRRPLWDKSDPDHKDKSLINQLWSEVAKKIGSKRLFARTKWKQLRYTFGTQLRKCKHKTPQWKWFKDLSFLTDQFDSSVDDGNCSCDGKSEQLPPVLSVSEEASSIDEPFPIIAELPAVSHLSKKKKPAADIPSEEFPVIQTTPHTSDFQIQSMTDSDANYYFLMSLLPQMSSLPLTKQWLLRLKIHELVVKDVLAHQHEDEMNCNALILTD